jgi:hypothetical protein
MLSLERAAASEALHTRTHWLIISIESRIEKSAMVTLWTIEYRESNPRISYTHSYTHLRSQLVHTTRKINE